MIERALSTNGQPFVIHRGGERIGEATGLKDGRSRSILFLPGVDILVGDWLEDSKGQTRLFVADVDHISDLSGGCPSHIEVLYETRIEYERQESSAHVIASSPPPEPNVVVSGMLDVPVPAHRRRARACFSSLEVLTTLTSLLSLCEYQATRTPRSATYWTGVHLYSPECVA